MVEEYCTIMTQYAILCCVDSILYITSLPPSRRKPEILVTISEKEDK
jgi:hypothetical protein